MRVLISGGVQIGSRPSSTLLEKAPTAPNQPSQQALSIATKSGSDYAMMISTIAASRSVTPCVNPAMGINDALTFRRHSRANNCAASY